MGFFLMLLAMIAFVVGTVGSIWLLIHAFQKSVGWGLAAFFLPFVIFVFGIMNFRDSKKPFLLMCGGTAAGFVFMFMGTFMMAASMASDFEQMAAEMEAAQLEEEFGEIDDEGFTSGEDVLAQADAIIPPSTDDQMMGEGDDMDPADLDDKLARLSGMGGEDEQDPGAGDLVLEAMAPPQAEAQVIPLHQVSSYEGALIRVKGKNGMRAKGRLLRVSNGSLLIERSLGAGTVSMEIAKSDIAGLELIRR